MVETINKKLIEDLPDAIVVVDESGKIVLLNQQAEKFFGYSRDELLGKILEILLPERFRIMHAKHREFYFLNPTKRAMGSGLDLFALTKDGREVPVDISLSPIKTDQGLFACAVIRDVTDQKNLQKKLHARAYYDFLTQLPNQHYFYEELKKVLSKAKDRKDIEVILFYLNIDHFKKVNNIHGRPYGDQLLKKIAGRIQKTLRHQDVLSKQAGDEFTIFVTRKNFDYRMADKIARRLINVFKKPFTFKGIQISCTTCIGISNFSLSGSSADKMIRDAEIALSHAKNRGPGSYNYFSERMHRLILKNILIENELCNAVSKEEFRLVYQPIVALTPNKNEICGVEVLLRWKNNTLGNVKPMRFIPIAEKSGLIESIDQWVVETACLQFLEWQRKYPKSLNNFMLAINLSASELHSLHFKKWFINFIKKHAAFRKNLVLVLEITETALIRDIAKATRVMNQIHKLGVNFSIDDFGSGYTSLYFLQKLPVSYLKIDQKFLREFPQNRGIIQIIDSIIKVGKSLKISVIAEGVTQKSQAKLLREKQCLFAQGYYFSVPLSREEFEKLYFSKR